MGFSRGEVISKVDKRFSRSGGEKSPNETGSRESRRRYPEEGECRPSSEELWRQGGAVKEVFGVCLPDGRNYFFPNVCIKKDFKILF